MPFLEGRVALITGAGSGLGKATAEILFAQGARVAVNDRYATLAQEVCQNLGDPQRCLAVPGDMTNIHEIDGMVQSCVDYFHGLDIVVNNAGVSPAGLVKTQLEEDWAKAYDTNLQGSIFVTQAAFPHLVKSNYGRVINISSEIAEHGMMYQAAYASTKAGVSALTKALARILGPHNITVNAICPGVVPQTNLVKDFMKDRPEYAEIIRFYREMCPLPHKSQPTDIANAVLLLASGWASFINGQLLTVNGGSA